MLRLSANIKISNAEAEILLGKLQNVLIANKDKLNLDIPTCFSGLLREDVSYNGYGNSSTAMLRMGGWVCMIQ